MTVMTRREARLLERLVEFAGDPTIVQDALEDLSVASKPPSLDDLLRKILQLRRERGLGEPSLPEGEHATA